MEPQILQWIGYTASGIIALSMAMNSIVKFRWINLVGALSFSVYGFLIEAFPVMILNGFIFSVDIYYLYKIYNKSRLFDTLEVRGNNKYLLKFLLYYNDDIKKFFPDFKYIPEKNTVSFFVLRNMIVSGIFLAHRENKDVLKVGLDYVIPEYRDHKNSKYVYQHLKEYFIEEGYQKVITRSITQKHIRYLKKIGFKEGENNLFIKKL